jgi:hypothetical protein
MAAVRDGRPPPGSTLMLYTDELVESPGADISTGMASLADALTMFSEVAVHDVCDALLTALVPNPTDDIAMLVARTSPVAQPVPEQPGEGLARASQPLPGLTS